MYLADASERPVFEVFKTEKARIDWRFAPFSLAVYSVIAWPQRRPRQSRRIVRWLTIR